MPQPTLVVGLLTINLVIWAKLYLISKRHVIWGGILSDKELGKKMVERTELEYFLDAYKYATGQRLELVYSHEKPDFICNQPHGMLVGVELTQVMRDPRDALWDTIIKKKEEMNPYDAVEILYSLLEKKDISRAKNY